MKRALILALVVGCGGDRKPAPAAAPVVVAAPPDAMCPELTYPRPDSLVPDVDVKVDLPAIPSFVLPVMANGEHAAKELQVAGGALLDTEVTVRGYVSWIYDCFATMRADPAWAAKTDKQLRKEIEASPDHCRRPLFRLSSDATAIDDGIKVVGVPRHPTKAEKKLLPKEELNDQTIWRPVPPLKVGDEVVVTGTWTQRSPTTGESDLGGLLVYGSLVDVTRAWPR